MSTARTTTAPTQHHPLRTDAASRPDSRPGAARPRPGALRAALPRLTAAWPLTWLLGGYPIWWALGLGVLIFPLLALPMAVALLRRPPRRLPPELLLWFGFLATAVVGIAALGIDPVGTIAGDPVGRLPGVAFRLVEYGSLTVLLLYALSRSERELPQRRLVALLAWLFVLTVAGGLLGTFAGHLQFTSPVELLLPAHLRHNNFVASLVHPAAAQLMDVLGYQAPRPAAPWGYTNTWGNNLALSIGWFVVAAFALRGRRGDAPDATHRATGTGRRLAAFAVLVVAVVPVVTSLNRGLWIDLALLAGYLTLRLALRGRLLALGAAVAGAAVLGVLLLATPLGGVVHGRLENGKSNNVRMFVTEKAVDGVVASPLIGLGSTRNTQGSDQSIAVGGTPDCQRCGGHTIGGNGQLWQVLYLHGGLGTLLYLGFFGAILWRHRRDASPIGLAGSGAIVVSLASMFYYNALVTPLAFTFLSYALLWRNAGARALPGHGLGDPDERDRRCPPDSDRRHRRRHPERRRPAGTPSPGPHPNPVEEPA
ncbi:hypothetical protein Athai_04760 [Actinocatenispora thailandica]|uniref:Ligase n=1 Tax=Actinocatenispora thailandica TaxID=227318 RepID=A0A7R7HUT0_9ACTN|nr:hypothetical protein [Actinocatenispora thailandica]BCJ32973.1 hypothetical protein Athai_04760 [Actinocatenispora thailandica]